MSVSPSDCRKGCFLQSSVSPEQVGRYIQVIIGCGLIIIQGFFFSQGVCLLHQLLLWLDFSCILTVYFCELCYSEQNCSFISYRTGISKLLQLCGMQSTAKRMRCSSSPVVAPVEFLSVQQCKIQNQEAFLSSTLMTLTSRRMRTTIALLEISDLKTN